MKMTPAATAAWDSPRARSLAFCFLSTVAAATVLMMPGTGLATLLPLTPAEAPTGGAANRDSNLAPAPPFYLQASRGEEARAVRCLTDAIYYEAADEPEEGQRAVAQVVLNRVRDPHFPKSVCGVVYEGWQRRTGCQFSFVCDGSIRRRHADPVVWDSLKPLAEQALNGYVVPEVGSATHYYAQYVRPKWAGTVDQVTQIGAHIFCSWKGQAGFVNSLSASYAGGESDISDAVLDGNALKPASAKTLARRRTHRVSGRLRVASQGGEAARG